MAMSEGLINPHTPISIPFQCDVTVYNKCIYKAKKSEIVSNNIRAQSMYNILLINTKQRVSGVEN